MSTVLILIILILIIILAVVQSPLSDILSQKIPGFKKIVHRIRSEFISFNSADTERSLTKKLFYKYNHNKISEWIIWVKEQNRHTQEIALEMLLKHLQGKARHWGNITQEVLIALKNFKDLDICDDVKTFFDRLNNSYNDYVIIPSLYKSTAEMLFDLFPKQATRVFLNDLSMDNIQNDKNFNQKTKSLVDVMQINEEIGVEYMSELINHHLVPTDVKRYTLLKLSKFKRDNQVDIVKNLCKSLVANEALTEKTTNETETQYDERLSLTKDILELGINYIDNVEILRSLQEICIRNEKLAHIIHQKVLYLINNEKDKNIVSPIKLLAFYLLPDTKNNSIQMAIGQKHQLTDELTRKVIGGEKLVDFDIRELKKNAKDFARIPHPLYLDSFYKALVAKLKENENSSKIFHLVDEKNSMLIYGDHDYEKVYFTKLMSQENSCYIHSIDLSNISTQGAIFAAQKSLDEVQSPSVLLIENIDGIINNEDESLEASINSLINELRDLGIKKDIVIIGTTKYSKDELRKDAKTDSKLQKLLDKIFNIEHTIDFPEDFRPKLIRHYIEMLSELNNENLIEFEEKTLNKYQYLSNIEFSFRLKDEVAMQLVAFGKIHSVPEVDKYKAKLISN